MRDDNDSEKQRMKGQTEVKHDILRKYLKPWMIKITNVNPEIRYIDGFAGWGYYEEGSPGSPLIAMNAVKELQNTLSGKLTTFHCDFIEADEENYRDLDAAVEEKTKECPPEVEANTVNTKFEDFAWDYIENNQRGTVPTFIFIDPFGFGGVSFEVISELVNLRSSGMEVFITFMSGKMAQYMETPEHGIAITDILGMENWRDEIDVNAGKDERADQFVKLFQQQLTEEAGVEYVWPFEMTEETKRQNCYYLVHATNHFDGFKLMKKVMFNEGAGDQFAYLGPDHYPFEEDQQTLGEFDVHDESDERIEEFAEQLHARFKGESLTFEEILKETYEGTTLIETHYKEACKYLEEMNKVEVDRRPELGGSKSYGIKGPDRIKFIEGLEQWI